MALWRLYYYHLIWATKERYPLITAELEPVLYEAIAGIKIIDSQEQGQQ